MYLQIGVIQILEYPIKLKRNCSIYVNYKMIFFVLAELVRYINFANNIPYFK